MTYSNKFTPSWQRLLTLLAFFLSAAASLPAPAGQPAKDGREGSPSTTVKFGDLDLNTDAGRRELLNRLRKGTDRVCLAQGLAWGGYAHAYIYSSCYRATLAAAVDKVHHAQLSALFAATSAPKAR
jgi:UrcA family protein